MNTRATSVPPKANPLAKMLYLIKRRSTTSREELVAHWFANHMPNVIQRQKDQAVQSNPHALRYIVTLFDANENREHVWDGMAQLWYDEPPPRPSVPSATTPTDTFQQNVEPYVPWATTEYIVIDGSEHLKVEPLTSRRHAPRFAMRPVMNVGPHVHDRSFGTRDRNQRLASHSLRRRLRRCPRRVSLTW